ncbi:hypothetical protein [Staphylococcus phage LY01]|nr:hypothetical protein [Staphylococcus phage LY01]
MNKRDVFKNIKKAIDKYRKNYMLNWFKDYLDNLEYGKDYIVYGDIGDAGTMEFLNKYILENNSIKNMDEINIEDLLQKTSGRSNIVFPYMDVLDDKILLDEFNITSYDRNLQRIKLYIKFNNDKFLNKVKKEEENFRDNSFSGYYRFHKLEKDIGSFLTNFKDVPDFLDYIKDKEEYKNLYKYLNKLESE